MLLKRYANHGGVKNLLTNVQLKDIIDNIRHSHVHSVAFQLHVAATTGSTTVQILQQSSLVRRESTLTMVRQAISLHEV
jgi:hypothetical protein